MIVNHKYVAKIMKKYGLNSVMKNKKYHKSGPAMKDFTNLKRNFQADTPYDKLVQDITEVKFKKQKAYINIIKDLCTKKIVAYNISVSPTVEFVLDTVKQISFKEGENFICTQLLNNSILSKDKISLEELNT